jgi:hypothetical protein
MESIEDCLLVPIRSRLGETTLRLVIYREEEEGCGGPGTVVPQMDNVLGPQPWAKRHDFFANDIEIFL